MKKFCDIKLLCTILLLLCFLLFMASCATFDSSRASSGEGIASKKVSDMETSSMPSPTPSAANTSTPKVIIPMDKVPDEYYHVDKNKLTPVKETVANSPNNVFKDDDGTQYVFDKASGEYRGFIPPVHEGFGADADKIAMDKLENAADELASHFVQVSEYERTYFYQEDTSVHKFNYCKKIKGYRTTDMGNVWISSDGNIELVSFINTGMFEDVDIPAIDEKALDDTFNKSLGENKCQKIIERTLTIKDNQLYIIYDYEYLFNTAQGNQVSARDEMYLKLQ